MTGEELKKYRVASLLTQKKLGEMLGFNGRRAETTVQKWEYGTAGIPVKYFRRLSEILRVPLEKFIP